MKKSLDELIHSLEQQFGTLTPQAKHCAQDFYENYEDFVYLIKYRSFIVVTSAPVLAQKIPIGKYTSYQKYGGLSMLLGIIGVILIFFYWKIAISLLATSFLLKIIARYKKNKVAMDFSNEIIEKFLISDYEGFFDIVQYYIAGIIQIQSQTIPIAAHLPLLPSVVLTGIVKYAETK